MATDWSQNYKRLYDRTSTSWRRLPCWVRGYGDELLRVANHFNGVICDSTNAEDVAMLLFAHSGELDQIKSAIEQLLAQGFLSVADGSLTITNLRDGIEYKKLKDAERQKNHRETRKGEQSDQSPANGSDSHVLSRPVTSCHVESPKEEKRREENITPLPPTGGVAGHAPENLRETHRTTSKHPSAVEQVFEAWQEITGHKGAVLDKKRASRIQARLKEGFKAEQLIQAIRGSRNEPFLMGDNKHNRVYDQLDTLLRDASQVERLSKLAKTEHDCLIIGVDIK